MDKLSGILSGVLHRRGLKDHADGALVVHRVSQWYAIRSPAVASFIVVRCVRDSELLVACKNAVAMQECRGMNEDLLSYLREECAFARISAIRIERS